MEVISLKTYWFNETIAQTKQKKLNKLLDDILASEGCEKGGIASRQILKALEWCDYLFVIKDKRKIASFAFATDHSDVNYHIWLSNFSNPQGFLTLDLICSNIATSGSALLRKITIFAKQTLNRKKITLASLPEPRLMEYYSHHKFKKDRNQPFDNLTSMTLLL
jgi:hypothetical protein